MSPARLPRPGLRMLKSALAVFLCFLIDTLRGGGVPFYSAIAAILCMQPDVQGGLRVGLNRVVGTLIGGCYGMGVLYLLRAFPPGGHGLLQYAVISAALVPLMYLTVLVKKTSATYITCVVFLSITVSHGLDLIPYAFALNRILDTLIGIFISLFVNWVPFLRNRRADQTQ
ncbi:aromatic acid exporter family protein [uncultured Anaerotruncus sp.]|uniref:FUSC family protein n=1 Tax=uncultured Anaerotruncus sp. TaxID=905011 RepID=UPI00280AE222|nr:aromatic acid exporter family protein [uncultured Anaerotruncus sp.]